MDFAESMRSDCIEDPGQGYFNKQNKSYEDLDFDDSNHSNLNVSDSMLLKDESILKIKVNAEDITKKSRDTFIKLLEHYLGKGEIEIRLKNYNESIRTSIREYRDVIDEEGQIEIETDEEDVNDDHNFDDDDDVRSRISEVSKRTDKSSINSALEDTREVKFDKVSDFVAIQAWKQIATRIFEFSRSKNTRLGYIEDGYSLKGSKDDLDAVEEYIRNEYSKILPVKICIGYTQEKIQAMSHSLKRVVKDLAKEFRLTFIQLLPSNFYYKTYEYLANKVPALKSKLACKQQKPNLRILLYRRDIHSQPEKGQNFKEKLFNFCQDFSLCFNLPFYEPLTQVNIKTIHKLASEARLYVSTEEATVFDKEKAKNIMVHRIALHAYYIEAQEKHLSCVLQLRMKSTIRMLKSLW